MLGDSLSAAHGIAYSSGWVALLEQRLSAAPTPRRVVNASISGETTSGGLARIHGLLEQHKPTLLLLELGANDALRGLPVDEPTRNLRQIIDASRKAGTQVVLIGIEIPINYGPQYRDSLRTMYQGLATEFNLPLVPFLLDGVALDPDLMQPDGLHPTAAAQPKLLETVWKVVGPVVAALPTKVD